MSADPTELPASAQPPSDDEEEEAEEKISVDKSVVDASPSSNVAFTAHTFTATAHNKMVLHALKYMTRPVIGLLIGYAHKAERSRSNIHVMDCIPLLHNTFSSMVVELAFLQIESWLSTLNEMNNTKKAPKLQIVGVYYANEFAADTSKLTGAIIIYEQLIQQFPRECMVLCQIDNERIEATFNGKDVCSEWFVLKPKESTKNARAWRNLDSMTLVQSDLSGAWQSNTQNLKGVPTEQTTKQYQNYLADLGALTAMAKLSDLNLKQEVQQQKENQIYDFEDHLDDTAKDWRNLHL